MRTATRLLGFAAVVAAGVVVRRRRPRRAARRSISSSTRCRARRAADMPANAFGSTAAIRRDHERDDAGAVHGGDARARPSSTTSARRASALVDEGRHASTPTTNNEVTITATTSTSRAPTAGTRRASTCRTRSTAPSPARIAGERRRDACPSSWCATSPRRRRRSCSSSTNPNIITTIADVTFYGTDLVGNAIRRTGSMIGRIRQLWGFVGSWPRGSPSSSSPALVALSGCTVHQTERAVAARSAAVDLRAVARHDGDARQHQPGRRVAVVGRRDGARPHRQAGVGRRRFGSTCR